jgi:hypothetical protein
VIVQLFVPAATKISENLGGSEYDILSWRFGGFVLRRADPEFFQSFGRADDFTTSNSK